MKTSNANTIIFTLTLTLLGLLSIYKPATGKVIQFQENDIPVIQKASQAENVKAISQLGGIFYAIDIQDGYAYAGEGKSMVVLDVHNPNEPRTIARTIPFENHIYGIAASGDKLYLTDALNLWILDISNPFDPQILGNYPAPSGIASPLPIGDILYATGGAGLMALDVSDPYNPVLLDSLDPGIPLPDRLFGIFVLGQVLYAGGGWRGLYTFDISNPSNLDLIGTEDGFGNVMNLVAVSTGSNIRVYMAAGPQITIADATNPANPQFLGKLYTIEYSQDLEVIDGVAYVADGYGGLWIVDVNSPQTPVEIARLDLPSIATDIVVRESIGYITNYSAGVRLVDISTPTHPTEITSYEVPAWTSDVVVDGTIAYLGAKDLGISIVDVYDPQSSFQINRFDTPGNVEDIQVITDTLYAADLEGGLVILDISNPTDPQWMSTITPAETLPITLTQNSIGVHVVGDYAYLANQAGGLWVVDVSDPTHPQDLGLYSTPDWYWTTNVFVDGDIAYVANSEAGLRIVDVTDPDNPVEISFLDFVETVQAVKVRDSLAYVANGGGGLRIVNVSDPSQPQEIGFVDTPGWANELVLDDNLVYIADYGEGVRVINVSDPQNPVEVGHYLTPGGATSVFQQGCQTYTSLWGSGMIVLSYTGPEIRCQVNGYVTDRYGVPIPGIMVAAGEGINSTTDGTGFYQIMEQPADIYTITLTTSERISYPASRLIELPPDWVDQNFIAEVPIFGLQVTSDNSSLLGTPSSFTATLSAGTNVSFSWDFGDNSLIKVGETVTHTYSAVGIYTVRVMADNVVSQAEATTDFWVRINEYSVQLPLILVMTE